MYCPCRESIRKRFIKYVLIEGLSAKTAPIYLANFPMRAALTKFCLSFLGGNKTNVKNFPAHFHFSRPESRGKKRQPFWRFLLWPNNVYTTQWCSMFAHAAKLTKMANLTKLVRIEKWWWILCPVNTWERCFVSQWHRWLASQWEPPLWSSGYHSRCTTTKLQTFQYL